MLASCQYVCCMPQQLQKIFLLYYEGHKILTFSLYFFSPFSLLAVAFSDLASTPAVVPVCISSAVRGISFP